MKEIRSEDNYYADEMNRYIRETGRPDMTISNLDCIQYHYDNVSKTKRFRFIERKNLGEKEPDVMQMVILRNIAEMCLANTTDNSWIGGCYIVTGKFPLEENAQVIVRKIASQMHQCDMQDESKVMSKEQFDKWISFKI